MDGRNERWGWKGSWGQPLVGSEHPYKGLHLILGPSEIFVLVWLFFNHFTMYNSVALSALMMLCNHHHYFHNFVIITTEMIINPEEFFKGLKFVNDKSELR